MVAKQANGWNQVIREMKRPRIKAKNAPLLTNRCGAFVSIIGKELEPSEPLNQHGISQQPTPGTVAKRTWASDSVPLNTQKAPI